MPRFVLLEHDYPTLHWDLMLEAGDSLDTWRLPAPPGGGVPLTAIRIGQHRRFYLDYEGLVGGDRGQVHRFDAGQFQVVEQSETVIEVHLSGARLRGSLRLEWQVEEAWQLVFMPETE
jgi:DNA polymerase Ligase (LigD)